MSSVSRRAYQQDPGVSDLQTLMVTNAGKPSLAEVLRSHQRRRFTLGELAPCGLHGRCLEHPSVRHSRHVRGIGTITHTMGGAQEHLCMARWHFLDLWCPSWQAC